MIHSFLLLSQISPKVKSPLTPAYRQAGLPSPSEGGGMGGGGPFMSFSYATSGLFQQGYFN
jgi:hypothetical protein